MVIADAGYGGDEDYVPSLDHNLLKWVSMNQKARAIGGITLALALFYTNDEA